MKNESCENFFFSPPGSTIADPSLCDRLNPNSTYIPYRSHLTPAEAPQIFQDYDLILDCTDNPATRYLISDTAVVVGRPVVSASALRTEGQLMVLNCPARPPGDKSGGPCYRCVFPKPPPADSVVSCADGGILGPVVGTMGVLQSLEAIKVLTSSSTEEVVPSLLLFSAYSTPPFRSIRLRSRRMNCVACSPEATITLDTITSGSTDYVAFCGSASPSTLLSPHERISAADYSSSNSRPHTVIDVRESVQYGICHLDNSINIPISKILCSTHPNMNRDNTNNASLPSWFPADRISTNSTDPIYVVCRLGNDSQIAAKRLQGLGLGDRFIGDIRGGFRAWRQDIDPTWPEY